MVSKKFAVLSGNQVVNVIVADSKEIAESLIGPVIELNEASSIGIGYIYNRELNEFTLSHVEPVLPDPELVEVPELAPTEPTTPVE